MAKKCKICRKEFRPFNSLQVACGPKCAIEVAKRQAEKVRQEAAKEERAQHREDKKRVKPRSYWLGNIERLVHQYVKHHQRKGEPCYTCGLQQRPDDLPQAFHVGHFIPAKMADPRRFMLENLRIQCNNCNAHNSGRRMEYKAAMVEEMGLEHVEWLECDANHKDLKERFPTWRDLEDEVNRWRGTIREVGLTPVR
jgi:hypothetical protein